jgi:UDPglucose--hexose-1-phosphate uridylyltransferase
MPWSSRLAALPRPSGGFCPFCEGNEAHTPKEILSYRRSGGPNGAGWDVRVIPNRFPAIFPEHRI